MTPPVDDPFWPAVDAALTRARETQAPGPRRLVHLAAAIGRTRQEINHWRSGRRAMPADVQAAIRAVLSLQPPG